jgi:cephalosporin hydroxylase
MINATELAAYYDEHHMKYRGVVAPTFHVPESIRKNHLWPYVVMGNRENRSRLAIDDVMQAYELMLTPIGGQPKAVGGEGTVFAGVDNLLSPVDAASFSALLWEQQPDLIIELGTECGGSAIFFASIMRMYSRRPKVITYDVVRPWQRACGNTRGSRLGTTRRTWKGYKSILWRDYERSGLIVPRVADVTSSTELAFIAEHVGASQKGVWVVDDGDHFTTPILVHFRLLARHVTPGQYYIIADTRLERTCANAFQFGYRTTYCYEILTKKGGPARAVAYLQNESTFFRAHFEVDRTPERWVFTQHPGGWLRRRCLVGPCPQAVAARTQPQQLLGTGDELSSSNVGAVG